MSTTAAIIEMASPTAVGIITVAYRARKQPQRPQRCKCRVCKRHPNKASIQCLCYVREFRHKCWACQKDRAKAEGLYWNTALDTWAPYPHGTAACDTDDGTSRQLEILAAAYVKGLSVHVLETYTERVLKGATVQDCLRADFNQFRDSLEGLKESLGSLRDQFPRMPVAPAPGGFITNAEARRMKDIAAEQRAKRSEANPLRQRRPVRVTERPGPRVLVFDYPISGQRLTLPPEDVVSIEESPNGAGVDVRTRNGRTFRNMRALGARETVQREFVSGGSRRRINPNPEQIERHESKAMRARAMGDMRSAARHTDEAERLRAGYTRADWECR